MRDGTPARPRVCCACATHPAAFQLFGRPKDGITAEVLQRQLHQVFGVALSMEDARRLFARYDRNGSGALSITEFVSVRARGAWAWVCVFASRFGGWVRAWVWVGVYV